MGSLFKKGKDVPKVKKPDEVLLRAKYATYRKRMAKSPSTITQTKSFSNWKKTPK